MVYSDGVGLVVFVVVGGGGYGRRGGVGSSGRGAAG